MITQTRWDSCLSKYVRRWENLWWWCDDETLVLTHDKTVWLCVYMVSRWAVEFDYSGEWWACSVSVCLCVCVCLCMSMYGCVCVAAVLHCNACQGSLWITEAVERRNEVCQECLECRWGLSRHLMECLLSLSLSLSLVRLYQINSLE